MSLETIGSIAQMRLRLSQRDGGSVGLVPTMGALHAGHLRLIKRARKECGVVVVSIFVNRIQFNRAEDYELYPRTLEADKRMCADAGVDLIFAPTTREMYPSPPLSFVEVQSVSEGLCGAFRPGHFRGVATVVMKLFQIVQPRFAYFGEKDAQQLAVIRRMVTDLNIPVAIVGVPTVREPDGLALSSRNQRLTPDDRRIAPMLYRALEIAAGEGLERAREFLGTEPRIELEYLETVDADTMQPVGGGAVRRAGPDAPMRIALAAWIGGVRLIDNIVAGQSD